MRIKVVSGAVRNLTAVFVSISVATERFVPGKTGIIAEPFLWELSPRVLLISAKRQVLQAGFLLAVLSKGEPPSQPGKPCSRQNSRKTKRREPANSPNLKVVDRRALTVDPMVWPGHSAQVR